MTYILLLIAAIDLTGVVWYLAGRSPHRQTNHPKAWK